ncbi:MAG: ABC transporter ATP-binding protein [Bacillota bacterium]|nr:ABC transporter ATP-binding protein [Bacillota bacterium]
MSEHLIRLENVVKEFGGKRILNSINLTVKDKEFLTLLGPSGCGKTTTLRIIGGFETPDSGVVYFEDQNYNSVPPYKRRVNTIFQKYALFTHLNVYENIAFGLRIQKKPEDEIKNRVCEMLRLVNLEGYEKRSVSRLSGGEQQRVAIARAVINHPQVLLLDEPLGALDLKLRKEMQVELKDIQKKLGITFVYVTHDQEEALTMSDKIIVMNKGTILQCGTPLDIYNEPQNAFVADFIGESNILPGVMIGDYKAVFAGRDFECSDFGFLPDENVDVVIRPEDLKIVSGDAAQLQGVVRSIVFKGVHYEMMVETEGFTFMIHSTLCEPVGTTVGLYIQPFDIHIMHKA